ncbi:MAG: hypothetical protein FJ088_03965 [Deltaproteobacteria bacterium]|nr:hypothetical protein [Deltaproteobacteria bacterium]
MPELVGVLSFEIYCQNTKLMVSGKMSGCGYNIGYPDCYPFEADVLGNYHPLSDSLNAAIKNGLVNFYDTIFVKFEGELEGELAADLFDGTWTGKSTDPPALNAVGTGTWDAGKTK